MKRNRQTLETRKRMAVKRRGYRKGRKEGRGEEHSKDRAEPGKAGLRLPVSGLRAAGRGGVAPGERTPRFLGLSCQCLLAPRQAARP